MTEKTLLKMYEPEWAKVLEYLQNRAQDIANPQTEEIPWTCAKSKDAK